MTIVYAVLGLTFLVFIHELGHYFLARRRGMKVEVFSIGFGKPILSWIWKGVKWQVGILPFGGYVKITGMEKEGNLEPYEIPHGFYAKKPWARIQVALAGPLSNLLFALLLFGVIWGCGGRNKPFSEFTQIIGFVDPKSELYQKGIRPGDTLTSYNQKSFKGYKDLVYASLEKQKKVLISGEKINYFKGEKIPYEYTLLPYASPYMVKGMTTIGILSPASYLIYDDFKGAANELYEGSPLHGSGIQKKDRFLWVDGELLFSEDQLVKILNEEKVLLTVRRGEKNLLLKTPRVAIKDLRLGKEERMELSDWRYAAKLTKKDSQDFFIPYNLTHNLYVQNPLPYVSTESKVIKAQDGPKASPLDEPLQVGDRIIAVDGVQVSQGAEFIREIQTRKVQIIVERKEKLPEISWKGEDQFFETETKWKDLLPIIASIGSKHPLRENGNFHLLQPVTPIRLRQFPYSSEKKALLDQHYQKQLKQADKIPDLKEKEKVLALIEKQYNRIMLGVPLQDLSVLYNPSPFILFANVFQEIGYTLKGLLSGSFSPKYLAGPIGIVQVMQHSYHAGFKEALFWLAAISLNLGILNLLPIPNLDGGHIFFSIIEAIRKKPMKAKTMQRFILPFAVLVILFFLYVTFNDVLRLFGRFF